MSMFILHVQVLASCPCPCCMSLSMLHVPCPCCMPLSKLHVPVQAACPCPCCTSPVHAACLLYILAACWCPCCIPISLLHAHVPVACQCPCCMLMSMLCKILTSLSYVIGTWISMCKKLYVFKLIFNSLESCLTPLILTLVRYFLFCTAI